MVAVVTVMGMSLHRMQYVCIYISGLFNCGWGQRGVFRKNAFSKVSFSGHYTFKYNNTSTLLPLLAENCIRTTQLRLVQLFLYKWMCRASSIPFQTKSDEFTLAQLTGASGSALSSAVILNPFTFANDSINHYSCSIDELAYV